MKWNSVEINPPKEGRYLGCIGANTRIEIYEYRNNQWFRETSHAMPVTAKYWMELPAPPCLTED
jgi:hypothetical protein